MALEEVQKDNENDDEERKNDIFKDFFWIRF